MKKVTLTVEITLYEEVDSDEKAIFNTGGEWSDISDGIRAYASDCKLIGIRSETCDE